MEAPKELINGILIFLGIGLYFLIINALGHADLAYLRLLNIVFIFYGVNKTIRMNLLEGNTNFVKNAISAMTTCVVGIVLSIIGLLIFSYSYGGDSYIQSLSESFLFGGDPSINTYCISLFFEGIASSVIVTFMLMTYWNSRFVAD